MAAEMNSTFTSSSPCDSFKQDFLVAEAIIYLYLLCPLCILGIFLNLASIHIYGDKSFTTTAFKYLRFLSLTDLLICIVVIPYTVSYYTPAATDSHVWVKLVYLYYIFIPVANSLSNLATLFNLLVTIERMVSVRFPTHKSKLFSPLRFNISCVAVLIIAVGMNVIDFFTHPVVNCAPTAHPISTGQAYIVFNYIRQIMTRLFPIGLLVAANVVIISTVQQSRNRMKKKLPSSSASQSTKEKKEESKSAGEDGANEKEAADTANKAKKETKKKSSKKDNQLTYMAICVAFIYIMGSIPMIIVYPNIIFKGEATRQDYYRVLAACANVLELSQSCLRFVIYFSFTTQFRVLFYKFYLRKEVAS
nr:G protein-coupled receptor [Proales similis]